MIVVLDANVFCADYRLRGGAFQVFLDGLVKIGARCCVPDVVLDEVLEMHRKHLADASAKLRRANHSWLQLTGVHLTAPPTEDDFAACAKEYREYLAEIFENYGIDTLPYPEISHRTLVGRALNRRKPFRDSGVGYRDSLIWATLVSLRKAEYGLIAFVSSNSKDFGVAPNLHSDLLIDLETGTTIELYNSLEHFNAAQIVPHLDHLENLLHQIQEDQFDKFSLRSWIDRGLMEEINRDDNACAFVNLEPDHGSVWVSAIKGRGELIVDDVRLLPSGDLLVSANVDLKLDVCVSANWEDCRHDDIREFFSGDCSGHPAAWVEEEGNIAFALTLKGDSFEVDSCEIDEIRARYGYDVEINPHTRRGTTKQ